MASNVFDQFDAAPASGGNVFDQFDEGSKRKTPKQMKKESLAETAVKVPLESSPFTPIGAAGRLLDTALATGSGTVAPVAAGIAGLVQGAKNLVSPGMPAADRV